MIISKNIIEKHGLKLEEFENIKKLLNRDEWKRLPTTIIIDIIPRDV
mgnify:CR=1 FL=1